MADADAVNKTVLVQSKDVILTVGKNTITLRDALYSDIRFFPLLDWNIVDKNGNKLELDFVMQGTSGDDSLENVASKLTINGGAGNDIIKNNYSRTLR